MNTADDDEELLLLRIKALKSTPRVNISVQFTSDSDNEVSVNEKQKKRHEKKVGCSKDNIEPCPLNSSNIDHDDDDDDDETKLREIALNSLRRRTTSQQASNVVVLKSNHDNQTTIQISQNIAPPTTDSATFQQVIISSCVVTSSTQETSAIQHDLISSTSEEHGKGSSQPISSAAESLFTPTDNGQYTCPQSHSAETIIIESEFDAISSLSDIDFKRSPVTDIDRSDSYNENKSHGEDSLGDQKHEETHIVTHAKDTGGNRPSENIVINKSVENIAVSCCEDSLTKEFPAIKEVSPHIHNEESASSESESELTNLNHSNILEKTYTSFTLKQNLELGEYSPSSPSETDEADEEIPENLDNGKDNDEVVFDDDVLSLCTSDKDESELDGISIQHSVQTLVKEQTATPSLVTSRTCLTVIGKSKSNHAIKNGVSEALDDTPISLLPKKSDQKNLLNIGVTASHLLKKDANSDACGLNIVLDRYLNEVAANKKLSEERKLKHGHDNENGVDTSNKIDEIDKGLLSDRRTIVLQNDTNSEEPVWMDCEPGPSGYMPALLSGYSSDSNGSVTDVSCVNGTETSNDDGLTKTGKNKHSDISNEDIKNSLGEQNSSEEGKRDDLKDVTCSICLGPFENRSFLNSCFHSFCYMCIIQWSELSRLCPLCKTKYSSLIHSVNTDLDYETYEFPDILPEKEIMPIRREFSETMDDGRRFRYRSTVVDHEEWEARRVERERLEQEYIASRQQRRMKRRLKWSTTKSMRKAVYQKGLHVKVVKQRGVPKYRDITPKFFQDNPALKHRLVPWLLRDLNVLLGNEDENIRFVMSLVLGLISKISMKGDEFKEHLRPLLFEHANHFVDELISFAASPYDIRGYDKYVRYGKSTNDVEITFTSHPGDRNISESIGTVDTSTTAKLGISVAESNKSKKSDDEESSDDVSKQVRKRRHRESRKEKKKKRKRKRRRLDSDTSYKEKKKKTKKGNAKKSRKVLEVAGIPLSKDPCEEFLLKRGKNSEYVENDGDISKDVKMNDDKNTDLPEPHIDDTNKKETVKKKSLPGHKDKKKRAELKMKRKHKKKYKYVKRVKHKRKRLKSSSSEDDENDEKLNSKPSVDTELSRKRPVPEQPKVDIKKIKSRKTSIIKDDEVEKPKKSLKRKTTSSETDQERLSKRKKKEKKVSTEVKGKHKKKDKKKKKKHKHRKSGGKNTHVAPAAVETNCSLDKKVDKELRSKIDHAINAIMDTKGGGNSSDDEDEFLNSQEVQDLLSKYKYNDKLDLIKDGDAYKTRAEVVQELLLIEKAITRRKEKKKQKQISQSARTVANGKDACAGQALDEKPSGRLLVDKATKKAEREKSYKVLIRELQEIEGRINSCRSSLQVKPSDMMETNR